MAHGRREWTDEEIDYLEEHWGKITIQKIAWNLNRTVSSVKNKTVRLNIGDPLLHMNGITISRLSKTLNIHYALIMNWVKKYDFPAKKKRLTAEKKVFYVEYEDFWKWADKNRHMIDFSRFDRYALGKEPAWVNEKRIADFRKKKLIPKPHNTAWTKGDVNKLLFLVQREDMTYPKLSAELQRTHGAIKRKLNDEGIKFRPRYLENHNPYSTDEITQLENMMLKGHSFIEIAFTLNRSEAGVRGKAERMGYTFKNGVPTKRRKRNELH